MKQFTSVKDVENIDQLVSQAISIKQDPYNNEIGKNKTLGLLFFNPSLRTRMSTQKAAMNLGMNVMVLNVNKDSWQLEFEDGAIMNSGSQEHIKDAIGTICQYCDVIGVRTFATLTNKEEDYAEFILNKIIKYSIVPVVSLESATLHPLQSLADLITIKETGIKKPKIAVTWAPHPKALPQAVTNSFLEWIKTTNSDIIIAHPKEYNLNPKYSEGLSITNQQDEALTGADLVYVKSWSAYNHYGKTYDGYEDWTVTTEKMALTNNGQFMHCLPMRRNVIATDDVVDKSLVLEQANNRTYAAQAVLTQILTSL